QINEVTFPLQLPPRYRIHPTFHVSLLKPFSLSATDTPGAEAEPPPPEVLDQPSIYMVHEILDSRRRGGHLEYLIDWEGYVPEVRSWVHPDRPAPRSCSQPRRRVRASGAIPGGGATSTCHLTYSSAHPFLITGVLITHTCTQSATPYKRLSPSVLHCLVYRSHLLH
ncbi:hypothetical protein M9458_002374, partial [Cirrhinus mrigala]